MLVVEKVEGDSLLLQRISPYKLKSVLFQILCAVYLSSPLYLSSGVNRKESFTSVSSQM